LADYASYEQHDLVRPPPYLPNLLRSSAAKRLREKEADGDDDAAAAAASNPEPADNVADLERRGLGGGVGEGGDGRRRRALEEVERGGSVGSGEATGEFTGGEGSARPLTVVDTVAPDDDGVVAAPPDPIPLSPLVELDLPNMKMD